MCDIMDGGVINKSNVHKNVKISAQSLETW